MTAILKTTEKAILFKCSFGTFWIPRSMIITMKDGFLSEMILKKWKGFKLNIIRSEEKTMLDKLKTNPTSTKNKQKADVDELIELISALVDPDECELDHHEFCQAHGHRSPCPHKLAKDVLRKYTDKYDDDESQIPF